ncbi:MAG: NAD-dependent epimerase/dehydratase family protein [Clostridia bacterium]|nr:NAD-dependent epimerase/dehydratase family protein [Clostridia bacterium]
MNNLVKKDVLSLIDSQSIAWEKLDGKSVLITGATGFIGSFIIYTLLERTRQNNSKINIVALVRNKEKAIKMFADYADFDMIDYIEQDVCTPIVYRKPVDYIIHCASNAAPKEYSEYPVETMKTNFYGTLNLLDFAKEKQVSGVLYVSTIEVYGALIGNEKISESDYGIIDASKVRSCYPLSKKACETLCLSYADEYGVPVKIGRLSYIFGPGMKAGDSKIVALFPRCIAEGKDIVLKSKGDQLRSYTYVSDAIAGLLRVLIDGECGEAYNIASKLCITTIADIAKTLVELYPEKKLKVIFDLPSEQEVKGFSLIQNAVLNSEKLEALGWCPKTDLKTGLKNVVEEQLMLISKGKEF